MRAHTEGQRAHAQRGDEHATALVHMCGQRCSAGVEKAVAMVTGLLTSKWFTAIDVGERPGLKGVEERGPHCEGDPKALDHGVEVRKIHGDGRRR
ncbi:hypothetical protein U1Q18_022351 [Sarracenia purpurea var. burkii]